MATSWKEKLGDSTAEDLAREIDIFDHQIRLRREGKLDEKIFAETRLRRGAYGQRYDNGQRHDGIQTQKINFPRDITKGPETFFDAPGMSRLKIPYGGLTAEQIDVLAEVCEEYSVGVLHVTTRQDLQMHYVHIENTPDVMRRIAAVGITTAEACGNTVRNVTACPYAGVCTDQVFDVTPYARAMSKFFLGHPDQLGFGRKFKIAFSGCRNHACGLTNMNDLGALAVEREVDRKIQRGFTLYVGGGLGAVPFPAKVFDEFVSEDELLPLAHAIGRVFARLGEKENRARARVKFLVKKMGLEAFREEVLKEKAILPEDPKWTAYIDTLAAYKEEPLKPATTPDGADLPEGYELWRETNVYDQRQKGYAAVSVTLPLGDLSATQMRGLADIARKYCGDTVRATVDQNFLCRWVSQGDVVDLYRALSVIGLNESGAGTIVDATACPGTDSCKLGISSSRGLAAELRRRLRERNAQLDEAIGDLHIKISGCFNSCGQHHIADIGFYGVNRNIQGRSVPHFQIILGGKWEENGGAYGLGVAAVPSKNIPAVVDLITKRYTDERTKGDSFQDYITRLGKRELKAMLEPFMHVPAYEEDPSYYSDWGDPREYTHGDRGVGECAGEVISLVDFNLASAEREAFEAQILLDENQMEAADKMAYQAMVSAAMALVKTEFLDVPNTPDAIVSEFRKRFYDTELFYDRFAKGKFANYLFRRHERDGGAVTPDAARQAVEEAQLFI
ncbi:MAG: nitrite/sulfite reductase, partial [Candidatus Hydrogenedentes bacterium]|nr:nitrite/sulfite reductase [Candidatus Hydrogenedentota bacterium]